MDIPRLATDLRDSQFQNDVIGLAQEFQEMATNRCPQELVTYIHSRFHSLEGMGASAKGQAANLDDIASICREQYRNAETGAILGIPWPWECLTKDTLGKTPGEFTIFYGRIKSMKTWVLLYCAVHDFLENNCRVLIWSKEMSREKMAMRVGSLLAGVDYQMFKKGLLPPKLKDHALAVLDSLSYKVKTVEEMEAEANKGCRDLMLSCGHDAPRNLSDLRTLIEKFQPHVLYLDSFYHLNPNDDRTEKMNERWKRVSAIGEDVKGFASEMKIPIVAVHQANRTGEKKHGETLDDLADADGLAREADLIIRVLKKPGTSGLDEEEYEGEYDRIRASPRRVRPKLPPGRPIITAPDRKSVV
jgi:replicative DNA helicase